MSKKFIPPSKNELIELYINQSLPMWKIAKKLCIAIGTVYNYIKKYEIPTRDQKETFTFTGHKLTKEQCEKLSHLHKGKIVSFETRRKIAEAKKIEDIGHKKLRTDGYIYVYFPSHPHATEDGYIMEHRLVMENYLNRYLTEDEVVHHIDGNKKNNNITNLKLMTTSEHMSYHMNLRWEKEKKHAQ